MRTVAATVIALAVLWLGASHCALLRPTTATEKMSAADAPCSPPSSHRLSRVPLRPQQTDYWCWAASGEMIMDYLGTDVSQCDQANYFWRRTPCCDSNPPTQCLHGGWPKFGRYGFNYRTSAPPLSWERIKDEIGCHERPIAASWEVIGGGNAHMEVIVGYDESGGDRHLDVLDPLELDSGMAYDEYVGGNGYTFEHMRDYYRVQRSGH